MFWTKTTTLWAWLLLLVLHFIQGSEDEERLINDIFTVGQYQSLARPVALELQAVDVIFGLSLQQIGNVDEKNEVIYTNLWLTYNWEDYKIRWNKSMYGGVSVLNLPSTMVWTPDILLYNTADEKVDSKFPTNVHITADGLCKWIPPGIFISSCKIDITWFPFDEQRCHLKFGSWSYDGSKLNLTSLSSQIDTSTYSQNGEWDLISAPVQYNVIYYDCCVEPYVDLTFTIHIRRRALYYLFNLIAPCALISSLAPLTFLLPPDSGEKIGLGITILLSLSVFQLIVADMVPSTSMAVPLIGVYFSSVMTLCTLSIIMTVIVLNLHHRSPDMSVMPHWIQKVVVVWLARLLGISRPNGRGARGGERRRGATAGAGRRWVGGRRRGERGHHPSELSPSPRSRSLPPLRLTNHGAHSPIFAQASNMTNDVLPLNRPRPRSAWDDNLARDVLQFNKPRPLSAWKEESHGYNDDIGRRTNDISLGLTFQGKHQDTQTSQGIHQSSRQGTQTFLGTHQGTRTSQGSAPFSQCHNKESYKQGEDEVQGEDQCHSNSASQSQSRRANGHSGDVSKSCLVAQGRNQDHDHDACCSVGISQSVTKSRFDDVMTSSIDVKSLLRGVLHELTFITERMREEESKEEETNDWKFTAMVVDRLCLWLFTSILVLLTLAVFVSPPNNTPTATTTPTTTMPT